MVLKNANNNNKKTLLEAALEDFPKSASERWIGFLVWCRCFLNNTKLIFSFSSGRTRPSAICRSTMSSEIQVGWSFGDENFQRPEQGYLWGRGLTHDLWQGVTLQVQQDAPSLQAGPELKQAVEGQCGDVGLAPSFPSFLHFLLELHPPRKMEENAFASESGHSSGKTYPLVCLCLPSGLFPLQFTPLVLKRVHFCEDGGRGDAIVIAQYVAQPFRCRRHYNTTKTHDH